MTNELYQSFDIKNLEQFLTSHNYSEKQLMQKAGTAAFEQLRYHWPDTRKITLCCGKGKNAGDGLVLGLEAARQGLDVEIYIMSKNTSELSPETASLLRRCQAEGLSIHFFPHPTLAFRGDVIVDALLGSGLKRPLSPAYVEVIHAINQSKRPVLAIDVPSGLDMDTGSALEAVVKANLTVTFIAPKQGLYTGEGPACCGHIVMSDLDIPREYRQKIQPAAELLSWEKVCTLLPKPRLLNSHKGDFGHVLVIGGDGGMGGAVRMAAEAAARVGAGLVTVATRAQHICTVNATRPEILCYPIQEANDLDELLQRATVIVAGPGLGQSEWGKTLYDKIVGSPLPKVMDADALNLLSQSPRSHSNWILTPHPGEAARLLNVTRAQVQNNRFKAIIDCQKQYGGVTILKGSGSLIRGQTPLNYICPKGNPGMATAGMGDILSGVIGGLLAQALSLHEAALAGVFIHALAGDYAATSGGERGLLASDLFPYLRHLVNATF